MKLRRTLALMVAFSGLAGSTLAIASAQDTKGKSKSAAPAAKAPEKADGKIEIYEGKKGWRWRIVGNDKKTIAMPTKSHEKKEDVFKELDTLKSIVNNVKPVEVKE